MLHKLMQPDILSPRYIMPPPHISPLRDRLRQPLATANTVLERTGKISAEAQTNLTPPKCIMPPPHISPLRDRPRQPPATANTVLERTGKVSAEAQTNLTRPKCSDVLQALPKVLVNTTGILQVRQDMSP